MGEKDRSEGLAQLERVAQVAGRGPNLSRGQAGA